MPGSALAYAAAWEICGPLVVHHVAAGLPPGWIGTDLERSYTFDGGMTLTAHSPGGRYVALVWQRTGQRNLGPAPVP